MTCIKIMKKFIVGLLTGALALMMMFTAVGCGNNNAKYVANPISGVEVEKYGFAVGLNAPMKTEILTAMNAVIAEADIEGAVSYYTSLSKDETPSVTLDFADLSDNTAGTLNVYTCSGFEPYEFVVD